MQNDDTGLFVRNPPFVYERLKACRVGIAGCGGLGSNCAMVLARSGIGGLVLVDYDRVELSNLNRQNFTRKDIGRLKAEALADFIRSIRHDIELIVHPEVRVTEENAPDLFMDCDLVVEACDTVESKTAVMRAFMNGIFRDRWLIGASGLAGCGKAELIRTHRLGRNIYVCGDLSSDAATDGVMASRVILTAASQANLAIRLLCGLEDEE